MRQRQGFTLVEVMVSLGVMTIAAMAIFAMQQQLIVAGAHARKMTVATQIAQNWIERLKMDAVRWTAAGPPSTTFYLKDVPAFDAAKLGQFRKIPLQTASRASDGEKRLVSHAFDLYGDDLDTSNGAPPGLVFCASYRLNWVFENQRVIRADVRVWWARDGQADIAKDYKDCDDDHTKLSPDGENYNKYHIIYLSTVLRAAI